MSPETTSPEPVRPGPAGRIAGVLGLLDELTDLARAGTSLRRRLEGLTGLRTGELQALVAVADGAAHPRAVAAATRQVDDAAAATVGSLLRRGLLSRSAGAANRPPLRVTEAGRVVLQQAEALQIRLLAAVVEALGERRAGELRRTVRALGTTLAAPRSDGELPAARAGAAASAG
jgi:DNA-binding MarR family transcriptional regulator